MVEPPQRIACCHAGARPAGWASSCMRMAVEIWLVRARRWPCWRPWRGPCRAARQGSCRGALSSPARALPGVWWPSSARILPRIVVFYSSSYLEYVFTKICMPPQRCLPEPWPHVDHGVGVVGSRVDRSVGVGRAVPARVLPGPLRPPGKGLAGGTCFAPLLFMVFALALL